MFTAQFIVALVLAGITAAAMPFYCKLTFPGKNRTTLLCKMGLSALFVISAVLAVTTAPIALPYSFFMLGGFVCAFVGDFFLGRSEKLKYFIIGSCFFTTAHALYITAFSLAAKLYTPDVTWFNGMEIGIYLALLSLMALIFLLKKPPFHKLMLGMFAYLCVIALMVTKAFGLGIRLLGTSPATVMLPLGALLFICSDYTLSMMRFNMHARTKPFKALSTASYFIAQTLLALSLFALVRL